VLSLWAAGFYLHRGNEKQVATLLPAVIPSDLVRVVARALGIGTDELHAKRLAQDFPLTEDDVQAIAECFDAPEPLARDLVERFSPKWFLGWRDITNATNEQTLIASAVPKTAVGHKFLLIFPRTSVALRLTLLAMLNSRIVDYSARQKLGGTSLTYFVIRQLPVLSPEALLSGIEGRVDSWLQVQEWLAPRAFELVYTAHDLAHLARNCDYDGPPCPWDEARRFVVRCELDAAFFHLYLPCKPDGSWRKTEGETLEQLTALKHHFPQPRDAVTYILDQFPIVRQKDERTHGSYRTKECILEIYDALLTAQRSGRPYQTKLNPPPGSR